jgi:hypothetical protein
MRTNKKIIIPAILIGGGLALYFLNKSGKLDKLKNLIKGTNTPETITPDPVVIGPGTTTTTANPLGSADNVKDFQKFFNSKRPLVMLPLVVDGIFGPLTAAAYNSYKDQYLNRAYTSIKKFYE